jgi:succinate dehydrogenase / fumarate reductase membrane anchor subunit
MADPRLVGGLDCAHRRTLDPRLLGDGRHAMTNKTSMRTALSRVRHLGSARAGTRHFWQQRLTSVALVPLTIGFIIILMSLLGRNHAAAVQILGSPFVAIVMMLFIVTGVYHMWLGMQMIIEDYVHEETLKIGSLMANTFFCVIVVFASLFAILKLSFGV